jgi:hypothetical protein
MRAYWIRLRFSAFEEKNAAMAHCPLIGINNERRQCLFEIVSGEAAVEVIASAASRPQQRAAREWHA